MAFCVLVCLGALCISVCLWGSLSVCSVCLCVAGSVPVYVCVCVFACLCVSV